MLAYLGFLFAGFLLYAFVYGRIRGRRDVDFFVVLGSGLLGSKVPPLLREQVGPGEGRVRRQFVAVLAEHKVLNGLMCLAITMAVVWSDLASPH